MTSTPTTRRRFIAAGAAFLAADAFAAPAPAPAFIADYERQTGGRVGFFAQDIATSRTIAWRAGERFALCSTFKASLAALVLSRVDGGKDSLERSVPFRQQDLLAYAPVAKTHVAEGSMTIGQMCEAIVEVSDNTCANLLLREVGGPPALTRFWRGLGDAHSRLDHDEPALNRTRPGHPQDTTTPAAMAATLRKLAAGEALAPASRERLVEWLVASPTGANKLRAGLPAAWRTGDKTGSNGSDASGDIAVTWPTAGRPIVVAAYLQGGTPSVQQQETVFRQLGQHVASRFG